MMYYHAQTGWKHIKRTGITPNIIWVIKFLVTICGFLMSDFSACSILSVVSLYVLLIKVYSVMIQIFVRQKSDTMLR